MKQTRKEKMPESQEEMRKRQLQHSYMLQNLNSKLPLQKIPTYSFEVGDEVAYGAFQKVTVEKVSADKMTYEIKTESEKSGIGYQAVRWWQLRPKMDKDHLPERIGKERPVHISYNNSTLETLLHSYYSFGIDMNPDYQRGYVWTQEDKEYLIDSVFQGIEMGRFALVRLTETEYAKRDCLYEILDGKQRLNALCEFYENRFPYRGMYYNDLHPLDKNQFLSAHVAIGEVENLSRQEILETFLATVAVVR